MDNFNFLYLFDKSKPMFKDCTSILIGFLKNQKSYHEFIKNLEGNTIENIIEKPFETISRAFIWIKTSEGHEYWEKIEKAWQKFLKEEF